jgi:acetyl esterase/lipase
MTAAQGAPPSNLTEGDMTVTARDGYKIPVRVYRPTSPPAEGSSLVVLLHGGGFCLGDLSGEEMNSRLFTSELGAVCVNVDYRLAPEHPFPVPMHDSWDALEWVRICYPTITPVFVLC